MGSSSQLRAADLVNIYRLIAECRDLWYDSRQWRTHLLNGLCRLVGGQVGVAGEIDEIRTNPPRIVQLFSLGWKDSASQEHWQYFVDNVAADEDPMTQAVLEILRNEPALVTRARHELVPDRAWYGSVHFNEFRVIDGVNECLYSYQPLPLLGLDNIHVIEIHRGLRDRRFNRREANIVEWTHREIGPLIGRQLASAREFSISDLTPRLRDVLSCLLEGESEKQAALRLGLSPVTVHEYIQAIYRRFGVTSRTELMARWIRVSL